MEKVIYGVNFILMFLIARYQFNSDNDKTGIITSLGVLVLLIMNLIFGFLAQIDRKPVYRHYYYSALGILVCALILLAI
jgi:Mg2+ and Co2+ transporter CorA